MPELKVLNVNKRVLKTKFTKFKDKLKIDDADTSEIKLAIEKCRTFKDDFKLIFNEIYEVCDEKAIDNFIEEEQTNSDKIDELYLKLIRKQTNEGDHKPESTFGDNLRLPKLSLPIFSGNITEWLTFRDLFHASVHNNVKLSNAQKLQYLKSSLKGDAFRIVQSIAISDQNYSIAWNLLEERFSNKKEQVFAYIKRLLGMSQIQSESVSAILSLVDNVNEIVRSLEVLEQKVDNFSDTLVMYIILQKLDINSMLWWERQQLNIEEIPKLSDLMTFLKAHARSLQNSKGTSKVQKQVNTKFTSLLTNVKCVFCRNDHILSKCEKFQNVAVQRRVEFVRTKGLCFNCLSNAHQVRFCKSSNTCRHCFKHHHSILHIENKVIPRVTPKLLSPEAKSFIPCKQTENSEPVVNSTDSTFCANASSDKFESTTPKHILLCTAKIRVMDGNNQFQTYRCILDSGSQKSYIKRSCAEKLGLDIRDKTVDISCLGNTSTVSDGEVDLLIAPHFDSPIKIQTSAFVMDKITGQIPNTTLSENLRKKFCDLMLADPNFHESAEIDILLGVNVFLTMLNGKIIKRDKNLPFALDSKFGWIISGATSFEVPNSEHVSVYNLRANTDELVRSFWELEKIPETQLLTKEEKLCEQHFRETHTRSSDGRYVVRLPFKPERADLGDSKSSAIRQFLNLEKRLIKNETVYQQYQEFMTEYLSLGHMEELPVNTLDKPNQHFYIPHHAVINESSLTTKLRVVFNASSKSSNGVSLNDILMNGPKVQDDLFAILLRFRSYQIAITGDLTKMYRQVQVYSEDCNFQKILWRDNPNKQITQFRLKTLSYGTTPAGYLATRVLKQLSEDEGANFPEAAKIIQNNCYVDDVLFGMDRVSEMTELISQLCALFNKGGFTLHKWCSNEKSMLQEIFESQGTSVSSCQIVDTKTIKVLGLQWDPELDNFTCVFNKPVSSEIYTKRIILSSIAKIFDPMGWLSPFIVSAKILIQGIWKIQIGWDNPVPEEIKNTWISYVEQLAYLNNICIPRKILLPEAKNVELHAFCDSSEKAYSAVIYIKSINESNSAVTLLTSKTRVAPLKTLSIPRLELCSAVLLVHLLQAVTNSLQIKIDSIYAWSDSKIVLAWLQSEPTRWKTFVANRVSEVQSILPAKHWHHVRSGSNPADCASRGLLPLELASHKLWWTGPTWLNTGNILFSSQVPVPEVALTEERSKVSCSLGTNSSDLPIMNDVSSFSRLKRIIAWCVRFSNNAGFPNKRRGGFLTTDELKRARNIIVKIVQKQEFAKEYYQLEQKKSISTNSKILALNPFMDDDGLIRVGGRLRNANISTDRKHPILLPKNSRIIDMIINHYHVTHLHAGSLLLLAAIRREFWIINARSVIRRQIFNCLKCHRVRAQTATQIMSDLPPSRVIPSRPFSKVGVDFAGAFLIKPRKGRGVRNVKGYICIFVCFCTKAVHIELVSDLTADSFIAALKRFVARRGKPTELFSDCGTNFVAANRELNAIVSKLRKDESVNRYNENEGIKWNFNPPSAPHFGGLWEAAVKSAKLHMKRTIGDQVLTIEEFSTLIAQIESCMNSRPLCTMSDDPSELSVLTPGHFIIGEPLTAIPEEDRCDENIPIGQRWKLTQKLFQSFWKRWSNEYITNLQSRTKWTRVKPNIKVNDLVLLKEEKLSPLKWKLGRVVEVFPSSDKTVRVVRIKTATGTFKRPIHKLSVLPLNN